jgi:hypothetical protein
MACERRSPPTTTCCARRLSLTAASSSVTPGMGWLRRLLLRCQPSTLPSMCSANWNCPVRMGLATGEAELRDNDYFGAVLNQC